MIPRMTAKERDDGLWDIVVYGGDEDAFRRAVKALLLVLQIQNQELQESETPESSPPQDKHDGLEETKDSPKDRKEHL